MGNDVPPSSSRSSFDASDGNARKRVCKACDRCRLKKSKCDGSNPCSRCRADNAICQFGERKKSHDKVYPKGYVELLEQHFTQLVGGLREMYRLAQEDGSWPGEPLPLQRDGHPLTHDILQRLDILKSSSDHTMMSFEEFEESPDQVLEALNRKLAGHSREDSITPPSDDEPTSPTSSRNSSFSNPFPFGAPPPVAFSQSSASNTTSSTPRIPHSQRPRFAPNTFPSSSMLFQQQHLMYNPSTAEKHTDHMIVDSPTQMSAAESRALQTPTQKDQQPHMMMQQQQQQQHTEMDQTNMIQQQQLHKSLPTTTMAGTHSGLTPFLEGNANVSWPQGIRTPGDINWDSWLNNS